jgi:hypothetical protein
VSSNNSENIAPNSPAVFFDVEEVQTLTPDDVELTTALRDFANLGKPLKDVTNTPRKMSL